MSSSLLLDGPYRAKSNFLMMLHAIHAKYAFLDQGVSNLTFLATPCGIRDKFDFFDHTSCQPP
jgi:hypothetical protein